MEERERISIQVFKRNLDDVPGTRESWTLSQRPVRCLTDVPGTRESCLRVSDAAVGLNSPRT